MGERTGISWTDHTFNPWWGCTKVSPGCDHCYAERDSKRFAAGTPLWGADADRRTFGDKHWNEPLAWERKAAQVLAHGWQGEGFAQPQRPRVFCASMADVFDNHDTANKLRPRLWELIRATPHIDWQILTKRIGNVKRMLPADWGDGYPNVWLGASVVNQEEVGRDIPKLLQTPAAVRFLSCEPLLGPVELDDIVTRGDGYEDHMSALECDVAIEDDEEFHGTTIDWVIVGGESGPNARPFDIAWARAIIAQCRYADVPVFMKQTGAVVRVPRDDAIQFAGKGSWRADGPGAPYGVAKPFDRAGADPIEWPPDLRVREFPK